MPLCFFKALTEQKIKTMNFYQELEYLTAHPLDEKDLSFIPSLTSNVGDEDLIENTASKKISSVTIYLAQQKIIKKYKPIIGHVCGNLASEFEGYISHTNNIDKLNSLSKLPFKKLFKKSLHGITRHTMKPVIQLVLDYYKEYITINRGLL